MVEPSRSLAKVMAELPLLTKQELGKVVALVNHLRGTDVSEKQVDISDKDDAMFVLDTLCQTLSGLGVEHTSATMLRTASQYSAFKGKVPGIMQYVRRQCPTRVKQRALLVVGITLLYENMVTIGLPVSSRYLMGQIHRFPSVLNAEFPGYAHAGLLGMVVREADGA